MSKILEKAFDASKKIVRSIFLGSPNLFTTSDLNRQIEAFKYQMDAIDDKTGMRISQPRLTTSLSGGTLKVIFSHELIQFKGCEFQIPTKELSINLTSSAPIAYLMLIAEKQVTTYDTDASHDIAGAKFEDGTSMASANQMQYVNESLVLTHTAKVVNYVGMVARFRLENGKLYVDNNYVDMDLSLCLDKSSSVGSNFNPDSGDANYPVVSGDDYDLAFSKIIKYLGTGKNYSGNWGIASSVPGDWNDNIQVGNVCTLRNFGPFVFITLQSLGLSDADRLFALTDLFLNPNGDGLYLAFKDLPDNAKPTNFLGATVNLGTCQFYYSSTGVGDSEDSNVNLNSANIYSSDFAAYGAIWAATLRAVSSDIDYSAIKTSSGFLRGSAIITLMYLRKGFS